MTELIKTVDAAGKPVTARQVTFFVVDINEQQSIGVIMPATIAEAKAEIEAYVKTLPAKPKWYGYEWTF